MPDRSQMTLFNEHKSALTKLEQAIRYEFVNRPYLMEALTHSSAAQEHRMQTGIEVPWNERLEFLGDAVLDLVIATELMTQQDHLAEGDLSRLRAGMVQEEMLAEIAGELGLGQYVLLGRGEVASGGETRTSLLADALEAIIGAVYLDGGFGQASRVVTHLFGPRLEGDLSALLKKDHKSALQEYTQNKYQQMPEYQVLDQRGPAHEPVFDVAVKLHGEIVATGTASSKKRASQDAAQKALRAITETSDD